MPLYSYICLSCNEEFEEIRSVSDINKVILCPNCKSKRTKKQISPCSFRLTGSQWEKDGYCNPQKSEIKRTVGKKTNDN